MINHSDVMALIDLLDALSPEQRVLLLDKYCRGCGANKDFLTNNICHCENDD
jgi:hypothetical protein